MIYLDNAATTLPLDKALEKYIDVSKNAFGNSSSMHTAGLDAVNALETARTSVASLLACDKSEVYFTSGGTESDNIAIFGTVRRLNRRGKKIITCAYEHAAVENCMKELEKQGFEVIRIGTKDGVFDIDAFENALSEDVILISVMYANNETGLINPIERIKPLRDRLAPAAYIHTDAVQAFGKLPCDVARLGVDLLSVSSHKIGGVKGIGALYIRKGVTISSPVFGGGHEKGIRSGTVNVPAAAAFGVACENADPAKNYTAVSALRKYACEKLDFVKTHTFSAQSPYVLSVTADGYKGETLLHYLNSKDILVATASACSSNGKKDGRVLMSQGYDENEVSSVLRISFCVGNTREDIDALAAALKEGLGTLSKGVK